MAALVTAFSVCCGDDLDVIVKPGTSPDDRGGAYERLRVANFHLIAAKLAWGIAKHPCCVVGGIHTAPWREARLSEEDQIACTLEQLWNSQVSGLRPDESLTIMLPLLEDSELGRTRHLALSEISTALKQSSKSIAPLRAASLQAMERIAHNPKEDSHFRQRAVTILFGEGDPNLYLDLAIELTSKEATPIQRAEQFRFCTPISHPKKLNTENYNRYLRHGFQLLEAVDDGKSGAGYFLALYLGQFIGMSTPQRGPGPGLFAPDRLPKYEGEHGLTREFFQDTVNNARKWWEENRARFEPSRS